MRQAVITGTGSYVPERVVTNAELSAALGEDVDGFVSNTLGIRERRWCRDDESTADLAENAARRALDDAGLQPSDVDLLIVSTDTPEYVSPATASVLHGRLGMRPDAGTFDVNSACAGFTTALDVAWKYLRADERYGRVLVVAVYAMSKFLDRADKKTVTIFADGAGAVVLQASEQAGILASELAADGSFSDGMGVFAGGTAEPITADVLEDGTRNRLRFVRKYPREVNEEGWPRIVNSVLGRIGQAVPDVDLWLWTQVNRSTIEAVMDRLGEPMDKAHTVMGKWGYTGSACLPMALDDAAKSGRLKAGDLVVLTGSGAGLSMGCVALRWTRNGSGRGPHMAETAVSAFVARARADADRPALRVLAAGGAARDETITWGEWAGQSRAFAASLIAAGHRPGQHVAILAGNAAAWPIADLGVLMAGGVSVGVYPTSAPAQVRQLLADCAAVAVVVDSPAQMEKVRAVRSTLPELRTVISVDHDGGGDAVSWAGWMQRGRALGESVQTRAELARRMDALRPDTTAILIYTSGSTGDPKGAALSHRTLLASAASIRDTLGLVEGDRSLSFLPFCHAAERIFGLYTRIVCGMQAGLVADHNRVWDAAREFAPTIFGGLPRFYEKAAATLRAQQAAATGDERSRWERTIELGTERSLRKRAGQPVPAELEAEWLRTGEPLLDRARELFGGLVRVATSGGATLPQDVSEYLDALGITVLGAYGLTEHLCAAFNRPHHYAFDSAGPPMPGTTLRLADDGEILLGRGPLTFIGYHGRPAETADAFSADGEWLRTGDLGRVGGDGALRVIGRKKELIALSNGKKVAPLGIEAALTGEPWIEQAMLYGEGRNFVSALLVIRRPALEAWAAEHARDADDPRLLDDPGLRAAVQAAVDRVNAGLSNPERVRRFALLGSGFSGDDLTPTLKLRRPVVEQRYRAHLEALYVDA